MKNLSSLLGLDRRPARERRARLKLDMTGTAVYAVGDVHGCLDALLALESRIIADAESLPGRKLIIMLGDYVDRGPTPSGVVEHLMAPPPDGFDRICLTGNHEIMMLDYLEDRISLQEWIGLGAGTTLLSYGIDLARLEALYPSARQIDEMIRQAVPASHVAFLQSLPILVETKNYLFVHAGIRPDIDLEGQTDDDLVLIRQPFYDRAHLLKKCVVHGHTPISRAKLDGMRLNIDTGAFFSGRLTAVRIWRNKGRFLTN